MNNDNKGPALPTRGPDISTDNSTLNSTAQSDQQEVKPPDGSVRIDYLLDEIVDILKRHLSLPIGAREALALSIARAHAMDAFQHSPLAALLSQLPAPGKTTLLSILGKLVPKPLFTSNATKAAVFRSLEKDRPTLLIDEADTFVDGDQEFTGILNACHSREGAVVLRCVGDQHRPKAFRVWAPVFLAKLGSLPPTLQSRAIIIPMQPARPDEQLERIGPDVENCLAHIREQLAAWSAENIEKLRICNPPMPAGFHNRRADNWRPLLAIAELAGGEWPARAREAALALTGGSDQVTREVEILSAIRSVFSQTCATKFEPQKLCEALNSWSVDHLDEDIFVNPKSLGKLLKNFFQIEKKPMRIEGREKTVRGYAREDFEDAFAHYLPTAADPPVPNKT